MKDCQKKYDKMQYFLYKSKKMCTICQLIKGYEMVMMVKNAQSLLEKIENNIEIWAERIF